MANRTLDERLYSPHDALFNVVALTDDTGTIKERFAYQPYGESDELNNDFTTYTGTDYNWETRFTGRRLDLDTGLQLNRNRYYHTMMGRWISRDPIGYEDSYNLYRYTQGNPLLYMDPNGTRKVCCGFRRGWVIKEDFGRTIECTGGRPPKECCREYGDAWQRWWTTLIGVEGSCEQQEHSIILLALIPLAETTRKTKLKLTPQAIGPTIIATAVVLKSLDEVCPRKRPPWGNKGKRCRCTIRHMPDKERRRHNCPGRIFGLGATIGDCQKAAKLTAPEPCRAFYGHCGWVR